MNRDPETQTRPAEQGLPKETPIQILLLEDNPIDGQLIADVLAAEGVLAGLVRVEDRAAFEAALADPAFQVILSDYALPAFDGLTALAIARERRPDVPFILVSGTLGEETAVESLRAGADDYVLKQRLGRLVPVVRRAMREAAELRRRRQAEAALRASEYRLNQAERLAHLGSWESDGSASDGRLCGRLVWSDEAYRIFGLEPGGECVTQERFMALVHPKDRDALEVALQRAWRTGGRLLAEHRVVRPDGLVRLVLNQAELVVDAATGLPMRWMGTFQDITDQRRAEEQLRTLARAVDQSPVSIMITNRAGSIEFVNPKFTRVSGYSAEEVMGKNPRFLKSGDMPLEAYRHLWATILSGREWRGEFHNLRKDGSRFWETASISPVRGPTGRITHLIAVKEDVTEKRLTEAKLLRAQRVESIGSLASGIVHDLNNILAPILMCAPLMEEDDSRESRRELARTIEECARRAVAIVQQLLGFARGKEGRRQPLQVRHLIREIVHLARETFPRSIRIEEACATDLWMVQADVTQIQQVLLNLCVNARDAMPGGGRLSVRAENIAPDDRFATDCPQAPAVPHVRIQVQDTGVGIPESAREHIFESFFTTKGEGHGTGLGLTTARGIVRDHGGFLRFTSREGAGTTFEFYLPAHIAPETEPVPPTTTPSIRRGRGELVLLVDDEPGVLHANRRALERHGYRVSIARDGVEALTQLTSQGQQVRAVVTDVMMAQMNGVTLCRSLHRLRPDLPLIVSSGGLFGQQGTETLRGLQELGIRHILHKPHGADLLLKLLAEVLQPVARGSTDAPPAP